MTNKEGYLEKVKESVILTCLDDDYDGIYKLTTTTITTTTIIIIIIARMNTRTETTDSWQKLIHLELCKRLKLTHTDKPESIQENKKLSCKICLVGELRNEREGR